jgi:hypothetical protein
LAMLSQISSTIRILSGRGNVSIFLHNVVMLEISSKNRPESTGLFCARCPALRGGRTGTEGGSWLTPFRVPVYSGTRWSQLSAWETKYRSAFLSAKRFRSTTRFSLREPAAGSR